MINKAHIAEMAKKVLRHERGLRDPQIMHPEREWLIGLSIMVVIFAASAVWSADVYLKNKNVNIDQTSIEAGDNATYREVQVKEALRMVEQREQELQSLLGVEPTTVAPEPVQDTATTTPTVDLVEEEPIEAAAEVDSVGPPQLGD